MLNNSNIYQVALTSSHQAHIKHTSSAHETSQLDYCVLDTTTIAVYTFEPGSPVLYLTNARQVGS